MGQTVGFVAAFRGKGGKYSDNIYVPGNRPPESFVPRVMFHRQRVQRPSRQSDNRRGEGNRMQVETEIVALKIIPKESSVTVKTFSEDEDGKKTEGVSFYGYLNKRKVLRDALGNKASVSIANGQKEAAVDKLVDACRGKKKPFLAIVKFEGKKEPVIEVHRESRVAMKVTPGPPVQAMLLGFKEDGEVDQNGKVETMFTEGVEGGRSKILKLALGHNAPMAGDALIRKAADKLYDKCGKGKAFIAAVTFLGDMEPEIEMSNIKRRKKSSTIGRAVVR